MNANRKNKLYKADGTIYGGYRYHIHENRSKKINHEKKIIKL